MFLNVFIIFILHRINPVMHCYCSALNGQLSLKEISNSKKIFSFLHINYCWNSILSLLQVFIWYPFSSARTPFNIYFSVSLKKKKNPWSFVCITMSLFHFHFLKNIFIEYIILDWLSIMTLKSLCHLLACIVADVMSVVIF